MQLKYGLPLLLLVTLGLLAGCKKHRVDDVTNPGKSDDPLEEVGLLTFSPAFPDDEAEVTLRFDARKGNGELEGHAGDVYAHIGVITSSSGNASDWKYVKTDWGENTSATRMVRTAAETYELKLKPREYFAVPSQEQIVKIALVIRNADGSKVARNADGSDMFVPIFEDGKLAVRFTTPEMSPLFDPKPAVSGWQVGQTITLHAVSSQRADLTLFVNGEAVASANGGSIEAAYPLAGAGSFTFTVKAAANGQTNERSFSALVVGEPEVAGLPQGAAANGVTFANGGTTAVFALTAPGKRSVYLLGDFNGWAFGTAGVMKRTPDGKTWWVEVMGLDPNTAYAYQFVVDGEIRIADPYAQLVLDSTNDQYIPGSTFPNLRPYPEGKTTGIVGIVQSNEPSYSWRYGNFQRPHKHDLVIYELLVRDFIDAKNYATLADTLDYFSNLGVNAVQLMPVNEFEGNSSWGYNPSFYFAPDKYYGTKNDLKQLIDECHGRGIAVILDVVLNHSFGQSPMVQLYFENGRPSAGNPWFNAEPMHPFNVGYDFNHESEYTKAFVKDVLRFWMEEYRVDGFRFDLSKGFTQKNSGTSDNAVGAWSAYDASRIAIWKDYNTFIRSIDQDCYVILEHFAEDSEEQVLAAEGMMLWNNLNHAFNEATMGWLDNSDFKRLFHGEHGFTQPNLISYMESHDEERLLFKNLQYGNSSGSYNIKELETALKRVEMAAAFLLAAPGPKMIWQFGELGYDHSIEENGRTGEKPILWEYNTGKRRELYRAFSRIIHFKTSNEIFRVGQAEYSLGGAIKSISLTHGSQQVMVVGNFDVVPHEATISSFQAGDWYDNMAGVSVTLAPGYGKVLQPGEYYVYSKQDLQTHN